MTVIDDNEVLPFIYASRRGNRHFDRGKRRVSDEKLFPSRSRFQKVAGISKTPMVSFLRG